MSLFSRRTFLERGLQVGAAAGLADLTFLQRLPAVSAADVREGAQRVHLEPDIEPLVRVIEDTPRPKVLDAVADQIRAGAGYQDLLAAVFLVGVAFSRDRWASSFTLFWSLIPPTWPAWRARSGSAGCRCFGRSTITRFRRRATSKKATGQWLPSRKASCPP